MSTLKDYSKLKNDELSSLLKERNLPHTGKKAEMVARLQEADKSGTSDAPAEAAAPTVSEPNSAPAPSSVQEPAPPPAAEPAAAPDTSAPAAPAEEEKAEEKPEASFASGLEATDIEKEIAKRKARAAKFGMDVGEEVKALERAKRFGGGDVGMLDSALSSGPRTKKRGQEQVAPSAMDDEGLIKRRRGGGQAPRGRGGKNQGGRGQQPRMNDKDREAMEKRKARFAQASA